MNTETRQMRFIAMWIQGLISEAELESALGRLR